MIITRQKYLEMLVAGQGNGLVKIVTGGRRCGKSFLLFQIFHQYLLQHGVDEGHLIEVSLDDRRNRKLCDPDALLDYLDSRIKSDGKTNFIFLDEIQLVDDFIGVLLSQCILLILKFMYQVQTRSSCPKMLLPNSVEEDRK